MPSPPDNIYLELTREFNRGRTRAIISSGQAVVLHRLAIMSKDGDWIVRETGGDLEFILGVLADRGASYRFGAPLDVRWMSAGWSSHFEFPSGGLRVRCDFFSRPPRLSDRELATLWSQQSERNVPYLDLEPLVKVKQTQRERDYAVIGELARMLPADRRLIHGRSARDLIAQAAEDPVAVRSLLAGRPLLRHAMAGDRDALEVALDKERRLLMRADEERLAGYARASRAWQDCWPGLVPELKALSLLEAHARILNEAESVLPFTPVEKSS